MKNKGEKMKNIILYNVFKCLKYTFYVAAFYELMFIKDEFMKYAVFMGLIFVGATFISFESNYKCEIVRLRFYKIFEMFFEASFIAFVFGCVAARANETDINRVFWICLGLCVVGLIGKIMQARPKDN